MLTLRRLSLVCALFALALAAPAPISPSRSGKWLLSHAQKLSLAEKSRLALHNTRLRRNIFKSLRRTDLPTSATAIPSRHSLDAFRQAHNTVRRAHAFRPKEQKMSRPNVAVLAGWFMDHQGIQSKAASQTNFPGLNTASIPHSILRNTRTLKNKIEQHAGRKAAPMKTYNDFTGLNRQSMTTVERMGITGALCSSSSECADGRICINVDLSTCSSGETCVCAPSDGPERCTSSAACSTAGEVCVQLPTGRICFSEETATAEGIPVVDDGGSGDGITGAPCSSSSECADGRICENAVADTCPAGKTCFCAPLDRFERCTSSADCSTAGEVCVELNESTVCFSEEIANAENFPIVDTEGPVDPVETPASNSTEPGSGSGDGITGAICTSSSECAEGRICVEGSTATCPADETCFCSPSDGFERCTSTTDCSTAGEVCVQLSEVTVCLSEEAANIANIPIVDEGPDDPVETPASNSTDSDGESGDGLTGTLCSSSSECVDGRICRNADPDTCPADETCFCLPSDGPEPCTSSADCSTAGEVCVQLDELTVCFSEKSATAAGTPIVDNGSSGDNGDTPTTGDADSDAGSESPDPGDPEDGSSTTIADGLDTALGGDDNDDEVCIDARALGHLSVNGLVFEKHAVSRVLCDENDSCATRGHMVVFRGHAMRMSTYCESVGCKEAVMEVNSPRFNRGMRIESNTKGLEYTVFAARYDTQAEESLIRMAVRLGL